MGDCEICRIFADMKIQYYIVLAVWYVFSLLPLKVHYVFSDLIFWLLYKVVGYRKKVVRTNLATSFPEKSEEELRRIERGFYHFLCDYLVETVKLMTMSREEMKRRMVFKNPEVMDEVVASGQSVALYLGHLCNWEWVSSTPLWVKPNTWCGQIYHPLENKENQRADGRALYRYAGHAARGGEAPQREGAHNHRIYLRPETPLGEYPSLGGLSESRHPCADRYGAYREEDEPRHILSGYPSGETRLL